MPPVSIQVHQIKSAKKLLLFAAVCLFGIYLLFILTQEAAKRSEARYLVQSLAKVLPDNAMQQTFDNNLPATRQTIDGMTVYQACKQGQPRYIVLEVSSDKGYSGLIKLLVAVDLTQRRVYAVRPLFHQETPGLGDQIDVDKSAWLKQFAQPLSTSPAQIAVKQDNGHIDAITGATITSRAVSNALRQQVFSVNYDVLSLPCGASREKP